MSEPVVDEKRAAVFQLAAELFDHARAGRTDQLVSYVEAGIPVNLRDDAGNSLLMLAAYYDNPMTVDALVRLGADVDLLNDRGQSPLAGAIFKQFDEVIDVLIKAGASPSLGSPSAYSTAVAFGRHDIAERFARN